MPTTEKTWAGRAAALPGWRELRLLLFRRGLTIQRGSDARVRGIVTDFCERQGWLMGVACTPLSRRYGVRFRGMDGIIRRTGTATTAVHAIILAAEARHRVDPARGWC